MIEKKGNGDFCMENNERGWIRQGEDEWWTSRLDGLQATEYFQGLEKIVHLKNQNASQENKK
jgi:hypothetical protein